MGDAFAASLKLLVQHGRSVKYVGCCPPHVPRLVSLRQVASRSSFVNVTATNDDLAAACLRDTNLGT